MDNNLPYKNLSLSDIEGEIWRDISGYENLYQVSNLGRIKSLFKKVNSKAGSRRSSKERILKQNPSSTGYLAVSLGRKQLHFVHVLVSKTFIPNPENKPQVNHKKGIKIDNRVEQLEWVTRSEQMLHAFAFGLCKPIRLFNEQHAASKPIICITNSIKYPNAAEAARQLNLASSSHIREVCQLKRKQTHGFKFQYA